MAGRMPVDRMGGESKLSRTTQKYVPCSSPVFASGPSFIVIEIVFRRVKWPEKKPGPPTNFQKNNNNDDKIKIKNLDVILFQKYFTTLEVYPSKETI